MVAPQGTFAAILAIGLAAGIASAADGPKESAILQGRVVDESGEPLPGVTVSLGSASATGTLAVRVTDASGAFAFIGILPAEDYTLTAVIQDYARVEAGPIRTLPGRTTRLDLVLGRSADLEETVRVEARGEIVDTESPTAITSFDAEFIEGIPIVGRTFSDVLTLAPGVSDSDGDGNVNVRGARDTGLQLRLDGTNVTNPLTGHIGPEVNLETIEELAIITAAAPAEYGRADGGFANVITKSGGNDFKGSLKVFHRSDLLDGDGSGARAYEGLEFSDTDTYLTAGGPFVQDRLWYFGSVERLDEEIPIMLPSRDIVLQTREGFRSFGKITWQPGSDHRLAFQINHDPIETTGNNLGPGISPETDFRFRTGGTVAQFTWTAIVSPTLLLQVVASHLNGDFEVDPVSDDFRPVEVEFRTLPGNVEVALLPCTSVNCQDEEHLRRFIISGSGRRRAQETQLEVGPYSTRWTQDVERTTLRSDLSLSLDRGWGQHSIKAGFEQTIERYAETGIGNPIITDRSCSYAECPDIYAPVPPVWERGGSLLIEVFDPARPDMSADGLTAGAYVQDSWKPLPNLTINAGVRFDREEVTSEGFTDFDPLPEAREALRRFDILCDAVGNNCTNSRVPGRTHRGLSSGGSIVVPPGHPAQEFDLNSDGVVELTGVEGAQLRDPFTRPEDRTPDSFLITNDNLSPRFSISWDPWSDGKTKIFGSWGKYYDRLFLSSVATEQQPQSLTARWPLLFGRHQGFPDTPSESLGAISIPQTDRDLRTPYTVEWTLGAEREIAPEWAASLTLIGRRGRDLLQDSDVNHITCKGFDAAFGVDPMDVCGDGGMLELDRFGAILTYWEYGQIRGTVAPNGAIDLYSLNPFFNQVLRVGNENASEYRAAEIVLRRRLHRGWQMLLGYTWSEAKGDSESFDSLQGNDPAVSDKVSGYLDFDQRHIVKWQMVAQLARGLIVGGTLEWASGLPFSFTSNTLDYDDASNLSPQRVFSVTGLKNDQRNESQLTVNARIEKRFALGRTQLSGFLEAENLLNGDELVLRQVDRDNRGTFDGQRRFGRRWEIGVAVYF